ncbi:proline-rich transmembrane protein 3 [Antennarius striatus]|uniref:proline-rich transmembrane protein 3 n=1 Tax=Antennarius striatus TaxID=241820 RepID=UPI0035B1B011
MAPVSLVVLGFLLSLLRPSDAQTIVGSSSFPPSDLPSKSSPPPTRQTVRSWPSLPPRGRSDVPVRVTLQERFTTTNAVQPGQRASRPTAESTPSFESALTTQNLSSGPVTRPNAPRSRTDTASLTSRGAVGKGDATTKYSTPLLPTLPSAGDAEETGTTGSSQEGAIKTTQDNDLKESGSGSVPFRSPDLLPTVGGETAQQQPQAQTGMSQPSDVTTPSPDGPSLKPGVFTLTTEGQKASTWRIPTTTGGQTGTASPEPTSVVRPSKTAGKPIMARGGPRSQPTTGTPTTTRDGVRRSSNSTNQLNERTQRGRSTATTAVQSSGAGTVAPPVTSVVPVTGGTSVAPTHPAVIARRNHSVFLAHPRQGSHVTSKPAPSISAEPPPPNATLLYWGDLSRTLAFAWELHVYGSASLFLLLFAGAALGLALAPGTNCPHHGALALANALLFLAGGVRAALFLIDPYGTRKLLPRPAVTALYNLPLHLLVWGQAALVLLALKAAGVSVLPSALERPPLVAASAVLQCTLLLAADLLSPALSPVVPVTLQFLSLCGGGGLCLGYLCYVFPRIRHPPIPHPEESRRKSWRGSRRIGAILGRVLVVCAVLGGLCCALHVHPTLWLYGLLGNWTRFTWGWWLVHFWARLLELAWGFSLLFLGSWLFWRPDSGRGGDESGGDGRAGGDLPSPSQSVGSPQRHTCWSKIVQSLRGKPCRKSDSNGVGGGGKQGEVSNNWTNLIRNQEQACVKDHNAGRNHGGPSDGSTGSLLRLQALGRPPQPSVSGGLDQDRDTCLSFYEFDLRPPSPIDLTRSIDEALHREHLLGGGSLFHSLSQHSQLPSPGSGASQGPWLRRNSDPQLLSESSDAPTESSMPLGGSILSSVPSRQVTAPPTPSHQGHRSAGSVPSSMSCPVSLHPSRTSTGHLGGDGGDDTRPFITPDSERLRERGGRPVGSRSYLEVSRREDSPSVSSEIIDL